MPLDLDSAVNTLITRGWDDNDSADVIKGIQDQTDNLIKSGKSDEEIQSIIGQTNIKDKAGEFKLFGPSKEDIQRDIVNEGFKDIPVKPQLREGAVPQSDLAKQQGVNVLEGGGLQAYPTPLETLYPAVKQLAPFPGIIAALNKSPEAEKYGLNPLPSIAIDPIVGAIEGLRKLSPDAAKFVEDSMNASPAFHNFTMQSVKNLSLYNKMRGVPEVDVSTLRDVSPNGTQAVGKTRLLAAPIIDDLQPTKAEVTPSPLPSLESKPSAIKGQTGGIQPEIDPITIGIAKNLRDYGTKISNPDIIAYGDKILDRAGIAEKDRIVPPEQTELSRTTAIDVAAEAKRHAQEVNDPILLNRANQIINNNGIIKPHEILNPSVYDLDGFTADLNINVNNKPKVDFKKLEGTAVVNEDGLPKEVYHGTPVAFDEFNLEKAQPGLYGTGIYFTDEPAIAGGSGAEANIKNINNITFKNPQDLGYANPRGTVSLKQIEKYYKPGKIVEGYGGFDKVIRFNKGKGDGRWSVQVHGVDPATHERLPGLYGQLRTHATVPDIKPESEPNVRPAYLNIKKPFDIDAPITDTELLNYANEISQNIKKSPYDDPTLMATNSQLYRLLEKVYSNKDDISFLLQSYGYDGIKHIGGAITGNKPHQVYIAFNPSQVISKFDPDLYAAQLRDQVNNNYNIKNGQIVKEPRTEIDLNDYRDLNTGWLLNNAKALGQQQSVVDMVDAQAGTALIKRATEVGVKSSAPTINDIDYGDLLTNTFGKPPEEPPDFGGNLKGPDDILSLPLPNEENLRGIPWLGKVQAPISVFNNLEAESGIPFLTELHNNKQIADARYTQMTLALAKESKDLIREVGKYDKPTKSNIAFREKASDTLEQISSYDKAKDIVFFKDTNGAISQMHPQQVANKLKVNLDEVKVAARVRWLYEEYWKRGATKNAVNPNGFIDFYNPKKMTQQQRFDYVQNLREDQRGFFQYPRTNRIYKTERDILTLLTRYQMEWARVEHLTPWQKQTAEPIYKAMLQKYLNSPRKLETINYVKGYILDTLRMPRDTAMNANTAMYDFVKNWVEPKSPYLANAIFRRLGDDRLGEGISAGSNHFLLNYYLRFRPAPAIRNSMQREFALPLLPGGNASLIKAQWQLLRSKEAKDKALLSGLMPYLEGGLANTNKLDMFAHAESGNMHGPFLVIHDGIVKDFKDGMSLDKLKDKWRVRLYPEMIQQRFTDLYNKGLVGDIRDLGPIDNGAALLGRYASMMTQFPKGPGEVPEYARTGPLAKSAWLFSTWTPMSIDYFSNILKDAVFGGHASIDLFRIGKIFAYLYIADKIWEGVTGKSLQSNPLTNLPNRVVQAPGPTTAASLVQYLTAKWNEVSNGILQEDDKGVNKWLADQAWKNLTSSVPGAVKDIRSLTGADNKNKAPKSIAP